jgi:hypothetical protein
MMGELVFNQAMHNSHAMRLCGAVSGKRFGRQRLDGSEQPRRNRGEDDLVGEAESGIDAGVV